jgi:xylulokinase
MACVLACDLGGTSFRAALVSNTGRVTHLTSLAMPIPLDRDGASEVDPRDWWQALGQLLDALADAAGPAFDAIEAVAISAITRTQVFLGQDGRVLRPAITWRDTRSQTTLPALRALLPQDHPETAGISAFHPLARLHWLAITDPACLAGLAAMVDPKDYLNFCLTGRVAIDSVAGARLIAAATAGPNDRSLLVAAGLPNVVPAVLAPTDRVGTIGAGLPGALARLAGRPVMAMATDTWASVLGLGALRPGVAYNLSGTSEVLGLLTATAAPAEGLLTVDWGEALTQIGGPSQSGADTLVWLLGLIGRPAADPRATGAALDAVLAAPRDAQPLLFLPYLQGERAPYWDPSLRGAFIGLNRRHGPADLAYAVLEGVAFLNRIVLDRAEEAAGQPVSEVRFGGGGAANARWCQIKADIIGRPVVVIDAAEPGLVGAAIVAFASLGRLSGLAQGQAELVTPQARYTPRPGSVAVYRELFPLFRAAEAALAPISRRLAGDWLGF